jgi:hypothetical protein
VSTGLAPRQRSSEPRRCRPPWQKDRSAGGQVPCGVQPAETGNRRPGVEKEARDASYPAPSHRGHRRQTVKPHTAGARKQDRPGQLSGKAPLAGQEATRMGFNFGTRETTLSRTDAEPPQSCSKGLLAGYKRFSEGVAERRDTDLSITTTFTTGLSRHNLSINHTRTPGRPTLMELSARPMEGNAAARSLILQRPLPFRMAQPSA